MNSEELVSKYAKEAKNIMKSSLSFLLDSWCEAFFASKEVTIKSYSQFVFLKMRKGTTCNRIRCNQSLVITFSS